MATRTRRVDYCFHLFTYPNIMTFSTTSATSIFKTFREKDALLRNNVYSFKKHASIVKQPHQFQGHIHNNRLHKSHWKKWLSGWKDLKYLTGILRWTQGYLTYTTYTAVTWGVPLKDSSLHHKNEPSLIFFLLVFSTIIYHSKDCSQYSVCYGWGKP